MSRRLRPVWAVSVAALSLTLAACGGGGDSGGGGDTIDLGFISVFSGRVAMLGDTGLKGAQLAVNEINEAGGVDGQEFAIESKDTAADPEQAVSAARDFVLQDQVDFLIDGSSSNEAFAVSQTSSQLGTVVITTASEADTLTAEENFQEKVFRVARSTTFDGVAAAKYAESLGAKNWMSISPDYAYGRDCTDRFFEFLPDASVGKQLWPALFEPDYTPLIQQIVRESPDAVFSCLWGGDLVTFIQQAKPFGLFEKTTFVTPTLADSLVIDALGADLPAGIHTGSRFAVGSPPTDANAQFDKDYRAEFGEGPTNWSIQGYLGVKMLAKAIEEAGSTEPDAVAKALEGLELTDTPWGDVALRDKDHTLTNWDIRWGVTDPARPEYPVEFKYQADWGVIFDTLGQS